jgi:hypothetical protein
LNRTFGILLFCCLIVPFLGAYLWLHGEIQLARQQSANFIHENPESNAHLLLTFSIEDSKTKLNWEHSREFKYQGNMYDIIRSEISGDSISYWCYLDRKESKLKKSMDELLTFFTGQPPQNTNPQRHLIDFYKSLTIPVMGHLISMEHDLKGKANWIHYQFSMREACLDLAVPPPKFS